MIKINNNDRIININTLYKIKLVTLKLRNFGTSFLNAITSGTEFGNSFREELIFIR